MWYVPVVSTRFGSLAHDFFTGSQFQFSGGDVGIFQADAFHGVNVFATVPFKFCQSWVHGVQVFEFLGKEDTCYSRVRLLRLMWRRMNKKKSVVKKCYIWCWLRIFFSSLHKMLVTLPIMNCKLASQSHLKLVQ